MSEQVSEQVNEQVSEQVNEQVNKEIEYAIECLRGFDEELEEADEREDPFIKGKYKSLRVGIHNEDYEMFTRMINLLKRLKKEREENQVLIDDIKEHRIVYVDTPEFEEKYISKDKIREKIKELEEQFKKHENEGLSGFVSKIDKGTRIEVLKELLEEN